MNTNRIKKQVKDKWFKREKRLYNFPSYSETFIKSCFHIRYQRQKEKERKREEGDENKEKELQ